MLIAHHRHRKGDPLPQADRERLAAAIRARGGRVVRAASGLSDAAMARALAGLPILAGTVLLVRAGLDRLDAEDQRLADADRIAREGRE